MVDLSFLSSVSLFFLFVLPSSVQAHATDVPTLLKQKENANDCTTSPRSQQVRQRKEQQFERIEEFDYAVDPKQDGVSTKSRGEAADNIF